MCTYDSQNVFSPFVFSGRVGGEGEWRTVATYFEPCWWSNVCTFAFQNVFFMVPNDVLVMCFPSCVQIVDVTLYFLSFAQSSNSSKVYLGWLK